MNIQEIRQKLHEVFKDWTPHAIQVSLESEGILRLNVVSPIFWGTHHSKRFHMIEEALSAKAPEITESHAIIYKGEAP